MDAFRDMLTATPTVDKFRAYQDLLISLLEKLQLNGGRADAFSKFNDKEIASIDDLTHAIEKEIMVGAIGQIQFSNDNKDTKINFFIDKVHLSYATINKRCFADDFYGIDLRIFKDQLMKNLFFIVRNRAYKDRHIYFLKP